MTWSNWKAFFLVAAFLLGAAATPAEAASRTIDAGPGTVLQVPQPEIGETIFVEIAPGQVVHLPADVQNAETRAEGDDLLFVLTEDRTIVLKRLLEPDLLDSGIVLVAGDASIPAADLVRHVLVPLEALPSAGPPEEEVPSDGIVRTGRRLLFSAEAEQPGYALYSYLLFRRNDPAGINFERRAAAVDGYLSEIDEAAELEAHGVDRSDINILYFLLEPVLTDDSAPERMREHVSELDLEEQRRLLLDRYDFVRARLLLDSLRLDGEGPYIVTYPDPLLAGGDVQQGRLMVQDLSRVPPDLTRLWVIEFKRQIARHRDGGEGLRPFLLILRTEIANIAQAFSVTREAVAGFIEIVE